MTAKSQVCQDMSPNATRHPKSSVRLLGVVHYAYVVLPSFGRLATHLPDMSLVGGGVHRTLGVGGIGVQRALGVGGTIRGGIEGDWLAHGANIV